MKRKLAETGGRKIGEEKYGKQGEENPVGKRREDKGKENLRKHKKCKISKK